VHLKDLGQLVAREIEKAGGVAKEFNTIAVDDGIAMGHDGMLYSLPSREIIADSVEYMVNAHCADAMVCISNCDKITPGMLMAALRINIPTVFVSGGPMESGKVNIKGKLRAVDLIDAMVAAADSNVSDADVEVIERSACPTCGSCSGMFTANSMNCLNEAFGLALPGNGTLLATAGEKDGLKLWDLRTRRLVFTMREQLACLAFSPTEPLLAFSGGIPTILGDGVSIAHNVVAHACTVGAFTLVGMGAIVLDGAEIGEECLIGAGAVVSPRSKIPPRSLVLGSPAKVVRALKPEEIATLHRTAENYVRFAREYIEQQIP
jgi:hypothetical protein